MYRVIKLLLCSCDNLYIVENIGERNVEETRTEKLNMPITVKNMCYIFIIYRYSLKDALRSYV